MTSHPIKRVLLRHNAKARRSGEALETVCARLEAGGLAVTVEPFKNLPEIARDITRLNETSDAVVVCGGDRSISSAAPAVIESGLPLGIISAGTANDLARTLSTPLNFAEAPDLIVAGQTKRIDVGMVNGHAFFTVASIGLSSDLAQKLDPELKKRFGRAQLCCCRGACDGERQALSRADLRERQRHAGQTYQIAVENGRLYGRVMSLQRQPRSMMADWISIAWRCRAYGSRCSWRGPSEPELTGPGRKCGRRGAWSSTWRHGARCRSTPTARL